jgi:hypothetical protein
MNHQHQHQYQHQHHLSNSQHIPRQLSLSTTTIQSPLTYNTRKRLTTQILNVSFFHFSQFFDKNVLPPYTPLYTSRYTSIHHTLTLSLSLLIFDLELNFQKLELCVDYDYRVQEVNNS